MKWLQLLLLLVVQLTTDLAFGRVVGNERALERRRGSVGGADSKSVIKFIGQRIYSCHSAAFTI